MLSLPKILLLLAVIAVVVLVTKTLRGKAPKSSEDGKKEAENKALDMNQCAVCGNYVAADTRGCERPECPYAD